MTTQSEDFNLSGIDRMLKDIENRGSYAIQTKTGEILEILPTYEEARKAQEEIENNPELDSVDIVEVDR